MKYVKEFCLSCKEVVSQEPMGKFKRDAFLPMLCKKCTKESCEKIKELTKRIGFKPYWKQLKEKK